MCNFFCYFLGHMHWSDLESDPDPLITETDPRNPIRIRIKMKRIRNTTYIGCLGDGEA